MQSFDSKILSKIKKCMALARSDNPHEAAAALRQAKALMDKHGISASHITMSEIGESKMASTTMARDKPASWEMHLAGMVGKAFGCKMLVFRSFYENRRGHINEGEYVFVGLKMQVEIASYTANVLIRKCKKARSNFISEKTATASVTGGGRKINKTRLGDAFAEGWVGAISKLVTEFAHPAEIDEAIQQHIDAIASGEMAQARSLKLSDIGNTEILAARAGMQAAAGESIHRPMSKNNDAFAIGN